MMNVNKVWSVCMCYVGMHFGVRTCMHCVHVMCVLKINECTIGCDWNDMQLLISHSPVTHWHDIIPTIHI